MDGVTDVRCCVQLAILFVTVAMCGCRSDVAAPTTTKNAPPDSQLPSTAAGAAADKSIDEFPNISIFGDLPKRDVKSIVELANAIPDISKPVLSLELLKSGEVLVFTGIPLGGGHAITMELVSGQWQQKSVDRWSD